MKVFLSHAQKDEALASNLANRLQKGGFDVWNEKEDISPGENWAKKMGEALDDSELMVILLTPKAMESDSIRRDIEFAIGSQKFADRVFSVFVGPTDHADKDFPWILIKLPHKQIESAREFGKVVKEIRANFNGTHLSHANA